MRHGSALGRSALITAVAQLASPVVGAFLGVLIGIEFRVGRTTDAFFFAYAIYGLVIFVAQSMRTTTITGLMTDGRLDWNRFAAYLRAVALVALFTAICFALLGAFIVPTFLPHAARATARLCLLVLLPAAILQLFAGLLAAALATQGNFVGPAIAYVGGAIATVVVSVALAGVFGIAGVAAGFVVGSALAVAVMARSLGRHHQSAEAPRHLQARPPARVLSLRIAAGAAAIVAPQIIVSSNVVFAARGGPGAVTAMSYAQMAISLLNTALTQPVMTVYAPEVARTFRHDVRALLNLSDRAFRAGAVLTPLAVAALCLIGPRPSELLLSHMTSKEVSEIFRVALLLSPNLLITQALMIPMLGVVTSERFGARATATLAVAVLHLVLCLVATSVFSSHTLTALSLASLVSGTCLALVDITLAFGKHAGEAVMRTARATVSIALVGAVDYLVIAALVRPAGQLPAGLLVFAAGSALYLAWLCARHRNELLDLLYSVYPQRV